MSTGTQGSNRAGAEPGELNGAGRSGSSDEHGSRGALMDEKLMNDVGEQLHTLRADLSELTRAVSALARDASGRLQREAVEAGAESVERIDQLTAEARQRAAEVGDEAYAAGRRTAAELTSSIRRNPLGSLAIAIGVGYLAGLLFRSRR